MQKQKIIKLLITVFMFYGYLNVLHAQNTLEAVIERTKKQKIQEFAPISEKGAANNGKEKERALGNKLILWSLSGVNDNLIAEIWQGDVVYSLPLKVDAKLPSGWKVKSFDMQSITLIKGKQTKVLPVVSRGSTGWEYPQQPSAVISVPTELNNSSARAAASALPQVALPPSQQNILRSND